MRGTGTQVIGTIVGLGLLWGGAKAYESVRTNVCVYVDNGGGSAPLVVSLDNEVKLAVEPGEVGKLECRAGERRITINRSSDVVFNEVKQLTTPAVGKTTRCMLNPEGTNRYWVRPILYGHQWQLGEQVDYKDKYEQLAHRIELLSTDAWFELEKGDFVLEDVPDSIRVDQTSRGATRYEVCRIERAEHDYIASARRDTHWTEQQFGRLSQLVRSVMEAAEE